jgi:bidirectional [NiFe] hydrogenase diaphorase subunit
MTPEELDDIARKEREAQERFPHCVNVCVAAGCLSCHSDAVKEALTKEAASCGLDGQCQVKGVGCMGLCSEGPLVSVSTGHLYQHVAATDAGAILAD